MELDNAGLYSIFEKSLYISFQIIFLRKNCERKFIKAKFLFNGIKFHPAIRSTNYRNFILFFLLIKSQINRYLFMKLNEYYYAWPS